MTDPTIPKAAAALAAACDAVVAAKDTLTKADQAIGDGDHGLGMARGFGAAAAALRADDTAFTTVGEVFSTAGTAVLRRGEATCDPFAAPERLSVAQAFARFAGIDLLATLAPDGTPDRDALAGQFQ